MDRSELINDITWYLEELLPYLYENTEYEDANLTKLCMIVGSDSLSISDMEFKDIADDLYHSELFRMWFLVQDWAMNPSTLHHHIGVYSGQLLINFQNQNVA